MPNSKKKKNAKKAWRKENMRKFAKVLCTLLCALLGCMGVLGTACSGRNVDDVIKEDAKQIVVGVYLGGYGSEFVRDIKADFEAKHANDKFADGTTGVQLQVVENKNISTNKLIDNYQSWEYDLMFSNEGQRIHSMIERDQLLPITDVVTQTLPGENRSIKDKMYASSIDWATGDDGEIYTIPWTEGGYSLEYDITAFEENNLYFAENGVDFVTSPDDPRSKGPDGKTGIVDGKDYTVDDGLPATYDDFFKVCNKMLDCSIIPVAWTGTFPAYMDAFAAALYYDYEGSSAVAAGKDVNTFIDTRTTYKGETDYISGWNADGTPQISYETVTNQTANKVFYQPGVYYALDFIERIVDVPEYYTVVAADHIGTQTEVYYSTKKGQTIGFLMDGNWWYNECKSARLDFDDRNPGEAHVYGQLPFPKAKAGMESPSTFSSQTQGAMIMSNKYKNDTEKVALVKEIIQILFSDAGLVNFTQKTNTSAPYNYSMTEEELAVCDPYGQQQYKLHTTANYAVTLRKNKIALSNLAYTNADGIFETQLYGHNPYSKLRDSGISATDYAKSIVQLRGNATTWTTANAPYFEY